MTTVSAIRADRAPLRLADVSGFVFDMDGTLVLGDSSNHGLAPLPGAIAITDWLRERGLPFVVFTNGTSRAPAAYARSLAAVGFRIDAAGMLTPVSSAIESFQRTGVRRVLALGGAGLREPLHAAGFEVLEPVGRPSCDAVLIGWYREFTMDALEAACHAVWQGAKVYSASQAMFFATQAGRALGTSRAIAAMIKDLTGSRIHLVGKPSLAALRCAARRLGAPMRRLAVVGDDPALEVPMAHRGRAFAIAVASGLGTADSYADLPAAARPHLMVRGVEELLALCRQAT
jgi:HAD superfamily hydrolase (TIGR01450 family)